MISFKYNAKNKRYLYKKLNVLIQFVNLKAVKEPNPDSNVLICLEFPKLVLLIAHLTET